MQRIDHTSNIPLASGAPAVEATVSPGFFRRPSALLGNQGTVVTADWLNDIQEELATVISTNGQTLAKGSNALLLAAIESQIDGNVATHAGLISNESVLGHLEVATAAEVLNASNNARAITPANLGNAFPGTYAMPGYVEFPGGLIIQWGYQANFSGSLSVTLPTAFPSAFLAAYCSVGQAYLGNADNHHSPGAHPNGLATIDLSNGGADDTYWLAIGH